MNKRLPFICLIVLLMSVFNAKAVNSIPAFSSDTLHLALCENTSAALDTLLGITDADAGQTETWSAWVGATHGSAVLAYSMTSTGSLLIPSGLSYTPTTGYSGTDTFSVIISDGISADTTIVCVTVNPSPNAGLILGPMAVCSGSTITLSDTVAGGVWTSSKPSLVSITSGGVVTGHGSGKVAITYRVTNGCGSREVKDSVATEIKASAIIDTGTTICPGTPLALLEGTAGGTWSSSSFFTAFVTGTTVSGFNVGLVIGLVPGTATITYTLNNSCGTSTATKDVTVKSLAECNTLGPLSVTANPVAETGLKVYPNPSDGTFDINLATTANMQARVTLTSITGVEVRSFTTTTNKVSGIKLDVPAGMYFVTAVAGGQRYTEKVFITR